MDRSRCGQPRRRRAGRCGTRAGYGTDHEGYGACVYHDGADPASEEVWRMARELADEHDVTPWDALLGVVRRRSARVAWVDEQLLHATEDPTASTQEVQSWLAESRREDTLLGRAAKAAIDAGVAERVVRNHELEGHMMATVLDAVLTRLDLDADQRVIALETAHRQLLTIDVVSDDPHG